jgi:hypothetical protein
MKTRAQLVARALEKLKVVGSGQTASAEDTLLVDKVIDPLMSDLMARGIFSWGDEDELPEEAFEHLSELLANATAGDFGKSSDEGRRQMAEGRLKLTEGVSVSHQPLRTEYF